MVIGFGLLHGVGEGIEGLKKACISRAELPELEDYKKKRKNTWLKYAVFATAYSTIFSLEKTFSDAKMVLR